MVYNAYTSWRSGMDGEQRLVQIRKPSLPSGSAWVQYYWLSWSRDSNTFIHFTAMKGEKRDIFLRWCLTIFPCHACNAWDLLPPYYTHKSCLRALSSLYNRTLPLRLLLPKSDSLYNVVCIHCYSGSMIYLRVLLSLQVILAAMFLVGYKTKMASIGSWVLYLSLTLRNTWLNFILDRWVHAMNCRRGIDTHN